MDASIKPGLHDGFRGRCDAFPTHPSTGVASILRVKLPPRLPVSASLVHVSRGHGEGQCDADGISPGREAVRNRIELDTSRDGSAIHDPMEEPTSADSVRVPWRAVGEFA